MVERYFQSFQDVGALFGFAQFISGSSGDNFFLVFNIILQDLFQIQNHRLIFDQRQHDDTEGILHLRMFVQLIENNVRNNVMAEFNHDAHTFTVTFIAQIRNAVDNFFLHKLRNLFYQTRLIYLIRKFCNNDSALIFRHRLNMGLRSDFNNATTRSVSTNNAVRSQNHCSSRKIRAFDCRHKLRNFNFRVIDQHDQTVNYLTKVMRRNIRSHTNSYTGGTINKECRDFCRQNTWLLQRFVVVRNKIDGFFFNIFQHFFGNFAHANFSITHCRS